MFVYFVSRTKLEVFVRDLVVWRLLEPAKDEAYRMIVPGKDVPRQLYILVARCGAHMQHYITSTQMGDEVTGNVKTTVDPRRVLLLEEVPVLDGIEYDVEEVLLSKVEQRFKPFDKENILNLRSRTNRLKTGK